jgi:hypothetical protein
VKLVALAAVTALVLAGCGAEEESARAPQTLPASALPQLASSARTLDADAVALDALQPQALSRLLEDAGFEVGREREFSGKTTTFDHVVARTLRFETDDGAHAYLDWLSRHGHDILGRAEPAKLPLPGDSGVAFTLFRCGSCKKELPTFLAGWRRGEVVLTLLAAGSGANPERFDALVGEFDGTLG